MGPRRGGRRCARGPAGPPGHSGPRAARAADVVKCLATLVSSGWPLGTFSARDSEASGRGGREAQRVAPGCSCVATMLRAFPAGLCVSLPTGACDLAQPLAGVRAARQPVAALTLTAVSTGHAFYINGRLRKGAGLATASLASSYICPCKFSASSSFLAYSLPGGQLRVQSVLTGTRGLIQGDAPVSALQARLVALSH